MTAGLLPLSSEPLHNEIIFIVVQRLIKLLSCNH